MLKLATAAIAVLFAFPAVAEAQYSQPQSPYSQPPPPQGGYYYPPPAQPVPQAQPPRERRLGIGIHLSAGQIGPADGDSDDASELSGAGIHAHYRIRPNIQLGVSMDSLTAEGDSLNQTLATFSGELTWRINPYGRYVWSVTGALGVAQEEAEILSGGEPVSSFEFQHAFGEFGGAVERRFGNIDLQVGLRVRGYQRNDEELDGPIFAGTDIPFAQNQSSAMLRLGATYSF